MPHVILKRCIFAMSSQKPENRCLVLPASRSKTLRLRRLSRAAAGAGQRQSGCSIPRWGRQKLNFQLVRKGGRAAKSLKRADGARFPATARRSAGPDGFPAFVRDDVLDSGRMARILDVLAHTAGGCGTVSLSPPGRVPHHGGFVGRPAHWCYWITVRRRTAEHRSHPRLAGRLPRRGRCRTPAERSGCHAAAPPHGRPRSPLCPSRLSGLSLYKSPACPPCSRRRKQTLAEHPPSGDCGIRKASPH